jgi:hypothetical protein
MEVAMTDDNEALIAKLQAQRDEAMRDLGEVHALNERLAMLLTGVANALRGDPKPGTGHSWHDLPELAARVMADRYVLREDAFVRAMKSGKGGDAHDVPTLQFNVGYLLGLIDRCTGAIDVRQADR